MKRDLSNLLLAMLVLFLVANCGTGPDPEPIPQTEILEIRLTPDTAAVGDTVLIHCVIEDSLDERFKFYWSLDEERLIPINGTITGPKIRWKASGFEYLEAGEVTIVGGDVRVDNGSEDSVAVTKLIDIPVKQVD
ncbi:hypothetical protein [Fodinibius saliphilus]|uniref:hypothetical protein n=1 Tax=Fodinibius saliphilus TaxID=1920650 RepID=UPI0011085875|nr:hypothetical protein [Fodinibius saliphilus]